MLPYRDLDDTALIAAIQQDDQRAFNELFQRYHQFIYYRMLKVVKIETVAEDIVADVFLRIWEVRHRITIEKSVRLYLHAIGRNFAILQLQKIAGDRKLQRSIIAHSAHLSDESNELKDKEYARLFRQALDSLPAQRQKVFELCRLQGMSYAEVSAQLGISRNTIKQHMIEAVKSIEKFFEEKAGMKFSLASLMLYHYYITGA